MSTPPAAISIYHITHVDNLASIAADGGLWSDATSLKNNAPATTIGMRKIKGRRLALPVSCHPGDFVGQYVPFYFCPRSIMLYLLHKGNHPGVTYRGGQGPIVHLTADLNEVVAWANAYHRRWAFSLSNAGAFYAQIHNQVELLSLIDWDAVVATNWQDPEIKERKQAEFLVHDFFPWHLFRRIGVHSTAMQHRVNAALAQAAHKPTVAVRLDWYY